MKDCGLYIGFSADLKRRMSEHEAALSRSTAHRLPVVLAYYEAYRCRPDAEGRERFLKSAPEKATQQQTLPTGKSAKHK